MRQEGFINKTYERENNKTRVYKIILFDKNMDDMMHMP
jgi:hypothetical protein